MFHEKWAFDEQNMTIATKMTAEVSWWLQAKQFENIIHSSLFSPPLLTGLSQLFIVSISYYTLNSLIHSPQQCNMSGIWYNCCFFCFTFHVIFTLKVHPFLRFGKASFLWTNSEPKLVKSYKNSAPLWMYWLKKKNGRFVQQSFTLPPTQQWHQSVPDPPP